MGHEMSGTIAKVGENVDIAQGTPVVANPIV